MITLPGKFSDLDDLVQKWARPTEHQRNEIRWSASTEEFAEFYDRVLPRVDSILDELTKCQLNKLSASEENLFNLAAAFAEAAPHHELYGGSSVVPHSFSARRFVPGHGHQPSHQV
ncbi:hypothetical protein [Hyphococcus sp. DH-69]|uniref:hypothetical protein n=1 Tax=Hyphococcus formosus TaxID=3143534 RepID=UPI00398B97A7